MKINFPFSPELEKLFKIYNETGDNLRIVGGAVRNFLLKKEISDIDLATKLRISDSIAILKKNKIRYIPTGLKHGTVTALINKKTFEITTLRSDKNCDGRFADVEFVTSYQEDAKRRDFTINALFLDEKGQIYDYFNGISDINNGVIKFINNPAIRIKEDYLRILRFFRFFCDYGIKLDFKSLKSVIKLNHNLKYLSADRVRNEFLKIINSKNTENIILILKILNKFQFSGILFSEEIDIENYQNLLKLQKNDIDFNIRIKFFTIFNKSNNLNNICHNLNFSNKDKNYILELQKYQIVNFDIKKIDLIKLLYQFPKEILIDFLKVRLILSKNNKNNEFLQLKSHILNQNCPKFILNGNDLLKMGITAKEIGDKLQKLKDIWIESKFNISKDELLAMI